MDKKPEISIEKSRNAILTELGEYSFGAALDEVNARLKSEKTKVKRLALLSAKSWILRNKLHVTLHNPYVYSLNEIEDEEIFSESDEGETSAIDSLFDDDEDDVPDQLIEVEILKNTSLKGHKMLKGSTVKVTRENAQKLIDEGKARSK